MTGIRSWTEEVTAFGVVVRIEHDLNHDALNAIHDFLNFQIADHQTGDSKQP
jgi:hypothetical protein